MMKGYDIVGPKFAKLIGINDLTKSIGIFLTNFYMNDYKNESLTLKQKIIFKFIFKPVRPILRIIGRANHLIKNIL